MCKPFTLIRGKVYSVAERALLNFADWTEGNGSSVDGYNCWDYFLPDGTYLGPDCHGIEPTWTADEATS